MTSFKEYAEKNAAIVVWSAIAVLVSAALFLFAQFVGEAKSLKFIGQGFEFRNTITVVGEGEVFVAPDTAQFSFAVIEEADTVTVAQQGVARKTNAILEMLKDEMDIPEKDIKTTSYAISPRYEYKDANARTGFPAEGERLLAGYEVAHWIEVKMENETAVGDIIARIGELGATNISNVSFVVEDEDSARRDARKKAIADAEEKAQALADDLDVDLIKIVSFYENSGPVYARAVMLEGGFGKGGDAAPAPEIPSGENKIVSSVSITYAIE